MEEPIVINPEGGGSIGAYQPVKGKVVANYVRDKVTIRIDGMAVFDSKPSALFVDADGVPIGAAPLVCKFVSDFFKEAPGGGGEWGDIDGELDSQSDLVAFVENAEQSAKDYAASIVTGMRNVVPVDSPTVGEQTVNPVSAGTYTNFGGLVVSAPDLAGNNVKFNLVSGVWQKVLKPITNISQYPFVKTSTFTSNADAAAVLDICLYTPDVKKKYFLKSFGRKWGSNLYYFFVVEEEGQNRTRGVCGIYQSTTLVESGEIQKLDLPTQNSSGVSGWVVIDWSKIALGKLNSYTDYAGAGLENRVNFKIEFPYKEFKYTGQPTLYSSALDTSRTFLNRATFELMPIKSAIQDLKIRYADRGDQFYIYWLGKYSGGSGMIRSFVWIGRNATAQYIGFFQDNLDTTGIKSYSFTKDEIEMDITIDWDILPQGVTFNQGTYARTGIAPTAILYKDEVAAKLDTNRLICPNHLFLIQEEKLPILKRNVISGFDYGDQVKVVLNDYASDVPYLRYVEGVVNLDPSEIGSSLRISTHILSKEASGQVDLRMLNFKDVTVQKKAKSYVSGKTGSIFIVGDSITDYDVTGYIGNRFVAMSGNLSFKGTRTDSGFGNEGRAGWDYKRFIGMRTTNTAGGALPPAPGASLDVNPFIRIATEDELEDHPTWCFENSAVGGGAGKLTELNYTQSQLIGTYEGDYYIFDFAHYIATNSITISGGEKLITLNNLGYNDIVDTDPQAGIENSLLGIEIFCKRMYAYRNDVVIGISPIQSFYGKNLEPFFSQFIERAIKLVNTLRTGGINCYIVPTYLSVDRTLGYGFGTSTDLSSNNDSKKSLSTDGTHPATFGRLQMSNVMTYFIANQL